ncbi:MAG: hypothetical protein JW937_09035 [Candidatus Omnitrophica bacterium]|nr:hypothetical protein [Candidatus Omnitrophota bacterium]
MMFKTLFVSLMILALGGIFVVNPSIAFAQEACEHDAPKIPNPVEPLAGNVAESTGESGLFGLPAGVVEGSAEVVGDAAEFVAGETEEVWDTVAEQLEGKREVGSKNDRAEIKLRRIDF